MARVSPCSVGLAGRLQASGLHRCAIAVGITFASVAQGQTTTPPAPVEAAPVEAAPVEAAPVEAPPATTSTVTGGAAKSSPPATSTTLVPAPPPSSTAPAATTNQAPKLEASGAVETKAEWLRDGFYFRMLSGVGYMSMRGDGPSGSASVSGMASNSLTIIGGSVARRWVFAGTLLANQTSGDFKGGPYRTLSLTDDKGEKLDLNKNATIGLASFGALVDWFPMESAGLHVGLGVGLGMLSLVNELDKTTQYGTSAVGTIILGYDWPIARAWALGLALVATGSTESSLKHSKTSKESGYAMTPFSLGVSGSILYF